MAASECLPCSIAGMVLLGRRTEMQNIICVVVVVFFLAATPRLRKQQESPGNVSSEGEI